MSENMRVLVYDGPHEMHIDERPRPTPGPGQVLLRLAYVGICGSDLHGYTGESGRRIPGMVMGHEASGWVEEVGDSVRGLTVGDPVTFNPAIPCNGRCGHSEENRCAELRVVGVTPDIQGAFADSILVDAARVVPLGGLDLLSGAMVEPMAVAVQTVRRCSVGPEDDVLVIGGGMIGQCVARAARLAGAGSVVVSEAMEERRNMAAESGFLAIEPDQVQELAPVDVAIDAVGISATAESAIKAVKKGGTVGFVGLGLPEISIPLFEVVVPERTIVGSFCYSDEVFEGTVASMAAGEIDLLPLLGDVVAFPEAHDAFESLATGERKDVKIVVSTGAERPGESR
jgi:2-desacetyl-2-hydroxyethyl bacteriochlorophyllide A dehydrogenase